MSGFENQQFLCPRESEGRKLTMLSNGMCTITLGFEFQYRGNHLKNIWVTCEGGPLTNFRACARIAGICWNVLQGQMHYGYHSTWPRVGGCHFWHSVSTMLERHSPCPVFPADLLHPSHLPACTLTQVSLHPGIPCGCLWLASEFLLSSLQPSTCSREP